MSASGSSTKNSDGADSRQTNSGTTRASAFTMNLTSDEVNYLVFRYLQESGFVHSAFTFVYESMLGKANLRNGDRTIPPGALISFLQKGLQYLGIEESMLRNSGKGHKSSRVEGRYGEGEEADFTLLSQPVVAALTRSNPPIQLNLPPAAAAAAVKARLETQANLQAASEERKRQAAPPGLSKTFNQAACFSDIALSEVCSLPQKKQSAQRHRQSAVLSFDAKETPAAAAQALTAAQASGGTSSSYAQQAVLQAQKSPGLASIQLALERQPQLDQEELQSRYSSNCDSRHKRNNASALNAALGREGTDKRKKLKSERQTPTSVAAKASSNPQHLVSKALATTASLLCADDIANLESSRNLISSEVGGATTPHVKNDDNDKISKGNKEGKLVAWSEQGPSEVIRVPAVRQQLGQMNGEHAYKPISDVTVARSKSVTPSAAESLSGGPLKPDSTSIERQAASTTRTQSEQQEATLSRQSRANRPTNAGNSADVEREDGLTNASASEILELRMHSSEVFMCAWNPVFTQFIATGSGDASARIWQMGGAEAAAGLGPVRLLPHGEDPRDRKNKDVTTLEWSSDGKLLATGSYDGVARVWSRNGALLHTLRGHKGPIFSLKWNKRGNYLLSGSYDKTTIVWDVSGSTGFVEQQFNDHQAPALDVDWKDDNTFASCSTDKTVNICRVGVSRPLKTYSGHTDEVNAVKWDPSGTLLASCSDDCTAKVWDVSSDDSGPLQDFQSHRQEIYTVKWSPTGPGSPNPLKQRILATASFDGSVRLWDIRDGSCVRVFSRHRDSVYSVAFSPSGCFLASGSLAGQLYIWNVQEGRPVKSYKGRGDIFEVAWNKEESRVAACFSSNIVSILDFKISPF